ncbi:MAG TPA: GvpL/GvpF family gas vesicle protein [Polyangia bacterium]|nr:GvpL/GvpF family gas vesicle protein [Polyangia bacterium]
MTATYLYALVRSAKKPSLARAPRGVPKSAQPRLLDAGDGLWLVAAGVPGDRYGEEALADGLRDLDWVSECALAHEAMVEHFIGADAVVPMKLFTIFLSDERALAHVKKRRRSMERVLARVAGRVEWGLRLTLDERRALAQADKKASKSAPSSSSGAAFLLRKKTLHDTARALQTEARDRAEEIFESLASRAADARRRPPIDPELGARLLLDAAYLVPAREAKGFRGAVAGLARALPDGYQVTLTGPWPPYNFVADGA